MNRESLGYWELPKPHKGEERQWHVIARTTRTVPFGYRVHPDNENLLEPIPDELEALELAKRHLKQYSYREVAAWLSGTSGRYLSHVGLFKRVKLEQKRKSAASIQHFYAQRYKEAAEKAEKLEKIRLGARRRVSTSDSETSSD